VAARDAARPERFGVLESFGGEPQGDRADAVSRGDIA
jgi:hypothetical protein